MSATTDVAAAIQNAGLGTLGTDLVTGPMRDSREGAGVPDELTAVLFTTGLQRKPYLGGPSAGDIEVIEVQILHRSERETGDSYTTSETKAKAIADAVHKGEPSGYVGWLASDPTYTGLDEQDRHNWSINVQVTIDTRS